METEYSITVLIGTLLFLIVLIFFILFLKLYKRKQDQSALEKIALKEEFNKQILLTRLEIQEQTLKTISQEIHDNVGQVLSLAKLNLGTIEETNNIANQKKINDTKDLVSKAIKDLRNLSHSLHIDVIAQLGLQQTIANELKLINNTKVFETELKVTGTPVKINPQKEMVLFRIVQEALNNCIKYSAAKKITVWLQHKPETFILQVEDDGIGFNANENIGIGMKSMLNRAQLIGGTFNLRSILDKGTVVTVEIPLNN